MPATSATSCSLPSLNMINSSLPIVRESVNSLLQTSSPSDVTPVMHTLLAQTTLLKMSHDDLLECADKAREQSTAEQHRLVSARQKLRTLRYERIALEKEIASARKESRERVQKLALNLPEGANGDVGEEEAGRIHASVIKILEGELGRRRQVKEEMGEIWQRTENERERLKQIKEKFGKISGIVKRLGEVVEPVRELVGGENLGVITEKEARDISVLPSALYVLGREALGYRSMYVGGISVKVEEGGEGGTGIYRECGKRVRVDVRGRERCGGRNLTVIWKWHEELKVASVLGKVEGMRGEDWLRELFPYDEGVESPNPGNVSEDGGALRWNVKQSGGGRPFIWANVVCGVGCLEERRADWVGVAMGMKGHLRFKGVVEGLYRRLVNRVVLEEVLEGLRKGKVGIGAEKVGLGKEPRTKVLEFVNLAREDWEAGYEMFREVWCGVVGGGGVKVNCLVGLGADYPLGPPVFQMTGCEGGGGDGVDEKNLVELGFTVNSYQLIAGVEEGFLLSGMIWTLLEGVDKLLGGREDNRKETDKGGGGKDGNASKGKKVPRSLAHLLS